MPQIKHKEKGQLHVEESEKSCVIYHSTSGKFKEQASNHRARASN